MEGQVMAIDEDPFPVVHEISTNINLASIPTTIGFLLMKIEEREKARKTKHAEVLENL